MSDAMQLLSIVLLLGHLNGEKAFQKADIPICCCANGYVLSMGICHLRLCHIL